MSSADHDCIVIGAGPGGYVAAIRAAQLGLRTAVVERREAVGGRCLHEACIPAKVVLRSAEILGEIRSASAYGIVTADPEVDFSGVAARRGLVIDKLAKGVGGLLRSRGIDVIHGEGALRADGSVDVGGVAHRAARGIILAAGSVPLAPPGFELGGRVIGTEEAWALSVRPASMVVLGAGASGAELASAYARLGARVHLFDIAPNVLPSEDPDVSRVVERAFADQGITLYLSTPIAEVKATNEGVRVQFGDEAIEADWLVITTGRRPDVGALGLDAVGVGMSASGHIEVDGKQATSVPGLYAIGDLVPGPALAHKASEEGVIAAEAIAGLDPHPLRHEDIPRGTFCHPNVGSFGLTEDLAAAIGREVRSTKVPYGAVGAAAVYGDTTGLAKVVTDALTGEILGAHVVGARATELVQQLLNVRALEGGVQELARIVHGHPTLSELVSELARAADGWGVHVR